MCLTPPVFLNGALLFMSLKVNNVTVASLPSKSTLITLNVPMLNLDALLTHRNKHIYVAHEFLQS